MASGGSEPAKKSGQNIPKNRCRTTTAETSGYTAAFERSMRLLGSFLEIETQIEETTATTLADVLIQA
jgi:hypothetical protein